MKFDQAVDQLKRRITDQCNKLDMGLESIECIGLNYSNGWYELRYVLKGRIANFVAFTVRNEDDNVRIMKTSGLRDFNLVELNVTT